MEMCVMLDDIKRYQLCKICKAAKKAEYGRFICGQKKDPPCMKLAEAYSYDINAADPPKEHYYRKRDRKRDYDGSYFEEAFCAFCKESQILSKKAREEAKQKFFMSLKVIMIP